MQIEENGNQLCCRFEPELNSDVCANLEGTLADRIAAARQVNPDLHVVFDMTDVRYISSAFLRLCLFHCKRAGVEQFRLTHVPEDIKKVFAIAGFVEMMKID